MINYLLDLTQQRQSKMKKLLVFLGMWILIYIGMFILVAILIPANPGEPGIAILFFLPPFMLVPLSIAATGSFFLSRWIMKK